MPSRYHLPHIDLSGRAQSAPYTSADSNPVGAGTERIREQHGARLRRELAAAYEAFDAQREIDQRLGEPEGVFLELELRPGTPVESIERKTDGYTPSAGSMGDGGTTARAPKFTAKKREGPDDLIPTFSGPYQPAG